MTKQAKILLIRYLASLESLWRPIRRWEIGDVVCAARNEPLAFGGGTVAQRKASERARAELASEGLVVGGELLPEGRRLARRWVYPFRRDELVEVLDRMKQRIAAGDYRIDAGVPESLIVGADDRKSFSHLQAILLPCLADGIVESPCTANGNAFYRFASVVSPDDVPEVVAAKSVDAVSDLDEKLCDVYHAQFAASYADMLANRERCQEIGPIPAPVAMPLESGRGYYDFAGITPLLTEAVADG